ncbi:c-type cytochrome [Zoogloea sp.]|uniref:c-type cytochrome n=1 Tax=Zoogloea sp. TaxID=49181 RepID=UPI00262E4279|nr:c-type cytochrome [Zoogloea sp.]
MLPPSLVAPVLLSLAGLGLVLAGPARGAELPATTAAVLAGGCVNCHGPDGRAQGAIPGIRGLDEGYLRARLLAFRDGRDAPGSVMTRLMKGHDTHQIEALAKWFAQGGTQ